MTVEQLYKVVREYEEIEIKLKDGKVIWSGSAKYIPVYYFNKTVSSICALNDTYDAFIRIEIDVD